ncbi:MAG: hypothetical protein KAW12_06250 [Candidatus Aminicenantes bacterium]|nr:hypothetical protein [Candidatus Aminicenantes bacterium]
MKEEIAVIFNPGAARGSAGRKIDKVEACLKAQGVPYKLFLTKSAEHLSETAARAVHKYPVIVGAGGDTTVTMIAAEILRYKKGNALGIIGLGSVNDLSREFGVFKLEQACRAIKVGRKLALDVGVLKMGNREEPFHFLAQASLGLGVEVNRYVTLWMEKHTFMSRFYTVAQALAVMGAFYHSYKEKSVPLNLDLKKQEHETTPVLTPLIIFTNTSISGKEFRLSPNASPVDGKLDCCILNAETLPDLINAIIQVKRQTHVEKNTMEIYQGEHFKIFSPDPVDIQADGEIFQTDGDIEISTLPGAINMIVDQDFKPNGQPGPERIEKIEN